MPGGVKKCDRLVEIAPVFGPLRRTSAK